MATESKSTAEDRKPMGARILTASLARLDELCAVNKRDRRTVVELLIDRAHAEWVDDEDVRLNP